MITFSSSMKLSTEKIILEFTALSYTLSTSLTLCIFIDLSMKNSLEWLSSKLSILLKVFYIKKKILYLYWKIEYFC